MAKANRSSKAKQNGFAGIPEGERKAVKVYIAIQAMNGKKLTPEKAYYQLQVGRADFATEKVAKEKAAAAERMQLARKEAQEAFSPALCKLADVRDVLGKVADGDGMGFTHETLATFARAALKEAASEIERAAFTLGFLPKQRVRDEGWFVDRFN